jgi:Zn-dependent alcohol dehydrogenases
MLKTMKAAVVRELGKPLVIDEVPRPDPGEGRILMKVEASGVCHTDLHAARGDWAGEAGCTLHPRAMRGPVSSPPSARV